MMTVMQLTFAFFAFIISAEAFMTTPFGIKSSTPRAATPSTVLSAASSMAGKYFQLEEMEDSEDSTTEIYLADDGSISVGQTDGPLTKSAVGEWTLNDNVFKLTLERTYETGKPAGGPSDIGEFTFAVERTFTGDVSFVGECVAVTGKIQGMDEAAAVECEVGYFNLIDTTDERLKEK
mmetsp:Transcript_40942/g.96094  ORF Transcript_40942/g.96094 Transcript_40942/m.96094 type:complete len:178 (-) Transcript_40942:3672-4205(-)